jgi:hypothetical protein
MDFQTAIVGLIIFFALLFAGVSFRRQIKSFSLKNSCGANCGCGKTEEGE